MSDAAFALTTGLIAGLVAALAMAASHYLASILRGRELVAPETYVWGCGFGILLPYGGWVAFYAAARGSTVGVWLALVALLLVVGGAGAGTLAGYAADWWHGYRARLRSDVRG